MSRTYSMAYLTSAPLSAPETITLAAKLGYAAVGLRVLPAAPGGDVQDLVGNRPMLADLKARMRDTGVTVFDVEIVRISAAFDLDAVRPLLELAGEVGAKAILVAGDDPDENRLVDAYARFCQAAAPYNLTADLEFMPWTPVKDASTALRVVTKAGQPNGGVLVDALHSGRSATTLDDIAAIPRHLLHYAQICDAPAGLPVSHADLIYSARTERLLPGKGGINIAGIFAHLPGDLPVSVELPNIPLKPVIGVEEWARQCLAASRAVLADVAGT